jgi:hypothetical protein
MIFAPYTDWAESVIDEVTGYPGKAHDDFVDSTSQALLWVRRNGVVVRKVEHEAAEYQRKLYRRTPKMPYAIT